MAGNLCGIEPIWASEVEPYPIAVTRSRFPNMKHLGNVCGVSGFEIEPVDIITFGSPCQDLSIAGKRAGLKHEENGDDETTRSGLFMEAVRIIKEMREATNGEYPKYAVWENVMGAFSSNKGEDFRVVLEELIKICEPAAVMPPVPKAGWPYADYYCGDRWSLAYRAFDAQYWGVAQRRRRCYLVLDLAGQRAREILFEREGLRGYFTENGTPWQSTTGTPAEGVGTDNCSGAECRRPYTLKIRSGCEGGGKGALIQTDKSATISTLNDQYLFQPMSLREENWAESDVRNALRSGESKVSHCVVQTLVDENILDDQDGSQITVYSNGTFPTLRAEMHGNIPCVLEETLPRAYDARGNGDGWTVNTITGDHENRITDYTSVVIDSYGIGNGQANQGFMHESAGTLNCMHDQQTVCVVFDKEVYNSGENATGGHYISEDEIAPTLRATGHPPGCAVDYVVRRLTPIECARLQGFPSDWGEIDQISEWTYTDHVFWSDVRNTHAVINGKEPKKYSEKQMQSWYNKLHTDSAEYKLWGNGIALPCALYVMQGIADTYEK